MTVKSFDKNNLVVLLDPPASQVGANESWVQPFADGRGADRAVFMLIGGIIGTNDVVLQLWQATSSGGANAKIITGATATVPLSSTGALVTVEIGPGALDNMTDNVTGLSPFSYVQARVTAASAELWTLVYFQHNLRYPGKHSQDATYLSAVRLYD
jgi:hypothetical protein